MQFTGNDTLLMKSGKLYLDGYEVSNLAQQHGTPLYIMSQPQITINVERYIKAFEPYTQKTGKRFILSYAYKANANLAITRLLSKLGCGADVTSGGELYIARLSYVDPEMIVFNGNCKTKDEIRMGIEIGIRAFNVDSISELNLINQTAEEMGKVANVCFRINPNVDPKTHPKISTGLKKNKFGLDVESGAALKAVKLAANMTHVRIRGVHCHIGSQLTDPSPFTEETSKVLEFIRTLKEENITIEDINLGGGLGIPYHKNLSIMNHEDLAHAIIHPLLEKRDELGTFNLILEPGRSIVATAGILVTKVWHIKQTPVAKWVMVDAGMNDMMRPAIYDAYHEIVACEGPGETEVVNVAGGLCESSDVFGKDRTLPKLKPGDYIAILDVGAYGISMANNYNGRGRPKTILTTSQGIFTIRHRETYADLISKDEVPPHLL